MSNSVNSDSTKRFTGLATTYSQYRPDYPEESITFIIKHCGLTADSIIADVGCGTGISSRAFARHGINVVGIEPNQDMLDQAISDSNEFVKTAPKTILRYIPGKAEATGLEDKSVDAILVAQAFHWFESLIALKEFDRILKEKGWLIIMSNERDETDVLTAEYGKVIRSFSQARNIEASREKVRKNFQENQWFSCPQTFSFHNQQMLTENGLVGRALSSSFAPKDKASIDNFSKELLKIFEKHQAEGKVMVQYQTSVSLFKKIH